MEKNKYKLGESKEFFGKTFRRVVAVVAIPAHGVSKGDVGGWVESKNNMSQEGDARVEGNARVAGNARVEGDARVEGNAWVEGNARVEKSKDYLVIGPIGSRSDCVTFTADLVSAGCFHGTFVEFAAKVKETHKDSPDAKEYKAALALAKLRFPARGNKTKGGH